jgi:hypothetical protein
LILACYDSDACIPLSLLFRFVSILLLVYGYVMQSYLSYILQFCRAWLTTCTKVLSELTLQYTSRWRFPTLNLEWAARSSAVYMLVVCMREFFLYQFFRNDLPWAYIYSKTGNVASSQVETPFQIDWTMANTDWQKG